MRKRLLRFSLLSMLVMLCGGGIFAALQNSQRVVEDVEEEGVLAQWSWKDGVPTTISSVSFEGNSGYVDSDVDGIKLYVNATNGKFVSNGDNVQFNTGTKLQVPVKSAGDVVTVVSHSYNFSEIKVGGTTYTDLTVEYTATAADASQKYVEVEATTNQYLYSVSVLQKAGGSDETVLYSWEGQEGTAIETGGTAVASDGESINYANSTYYTIRLNGKNDYSTNVITITLDEELEAGDIISVTGYRNKDAAGKTSGFKAKFDQGGEVASAAGTEFVNINSAVAGTDEYGTEPNTCTFEVPAAAAGSTIITATRSHGSTNLFITKLVITRKAAGDKPTLPITGTWDFTNADVVAAVTALDKTTTPGTVKAVEDNGLLLTVEANGQTIRNNGNSIQTGDPVVFKVPVQGKKDVVTVVGYPGFFAYSIAGVDATEATTSYTATAADVAQGYVEIVSKGQYLISISVTQKEDESGLVEKAIIDTDFQDWAKSSEATEVTTKYTQEDITFTYSNATVDPDATNESKFPTTSDAALKGYIMSAKSEATITTSTFSSISKVRFRHGATGSNRGWGLMMKVGNGDWETISEATAQSPTWVEVEINKEDVQLQWYNLNTSQNAYMFELEVYANIDLTGCPLLGTMKANGTTYVADKIFEMGNDGNYHATIEVAAAETMPSTENPVEAIADNGEIGNITYDYNQASDETVVTIPVTADEASVEYIATFVRKPIYTLTYIDIDGTTILGTQEVEKDAKIGEFAVDIENVAAVTDGYKARGWFKQNYVGEKWTTESVITGDATLYAVETEIEGPSDYKKYVFKLNDKFFYAEDHEAFVPTGSGKFHDTTHGWSFVDGDKINLLVGGKATILITLCKEGHGTGIAIKKGDETLETLEGKSATDGTVTSYEYEGEAGTLTLEMQADGGQMYIHDVTIMNTTTTNYEKDGDWIIVKPGDASSLLDAIDAANGVAGTEPVFIYVPNGEYDLKQTALTKISRNNISLIGESMEGVVIKNRPVKEGISITATLLNTSNNFYMQDVTLECIAPYGTGDDTKSAERGVCFQDKGTNTILKNVYLKGLQDTYYNNASEGMFGYFETSKIEGTVDFICGSGSVMFNACELYIANRTQSPSSANVITAPRTYESEKGYLFYSCIVDGTAEQDGKFNFGRPWQEYPTATFMNTELKIASSAAGWTSMNSVKGIRFHEFYTTYNNEEITTHNVDACATTGTKDPLYLTEDDLAPYEYTAFFGDWDPATDAEQLVFETAPTIKDGVISWTAVEGATAFLLYGVEEQPIIIAGNVTSCELAPTAPALAPSMEGETPTYTIRIANRRGGLGVPQTVTVADGIANVNRETISNNQYYTLDGRLVKNPGKGIYIVNGKKTILK